MARLIFEGLTAKQADLLADWFEGQGEQDCDMWLFEQGEPSPVTDMQRKGGYKHVDEKTGDVTLYCRTP